MRNWRPVSKHLNIYEYDTKSGKKYGVRRGFTDEKGKYNEFTKSGFRTWRDADIELKKFENALNTNSANPIIGERKTLDEVFNAVRDFRISAGIWKTGTAKNMTNYYKRYLSPVFGNQQIGKIDRLRYEKFLNDLGKKNLAHTTIRTINSVMQSILNFAVTHDWLMKNRLQHPVMPDGRNAKNKTIEAQDYKKWLETAQSALSKYEFAIILLSTLGARRGEIMGLRMQDLEFSGNNCAISWTINRTADEPLGTTLKTKSSYRTNVVSGLMVDNLRFLIRHAKEIKANHNAILNKTDFMLLNEDTGSPMHPYSLNHFFNKVNRKSGLHFTPHMLRHYFATEGMSNPKVADVDIMHWLGHTNLSMTTDYTRLTKENSLNTYGTLEGKIIPVQKRKN